MVGDMVIVRLRDDGVSVIDEVEGGVTAVLL
jgi:hypothetical protein